jgi:hypothetical protein
MLRNIGVNERNIGVECKSGDVFSKKKLYGKLFYISLLRRVLPLWIKKSSVFWVTFGLNWELTFENN